MTIDLTKALQATDEDGKVLKVKVQNPNLGGDYPILTVVGENPDDPNDQTIVRFSLDGESRKGTYTLENVSDGRVELPASLRLRVRHPKYGAGTVVATRKHDTRSTLVKFDTYTRDTVWAADRKLTSIAA